MHTKPFKLLLKTTLIALLGLGLPSGMLYADSAPISACQPVSLKVVNSSSQDLSVRGGQGTMVIPANSSTQVTFQSNHFYTKCGLIEVGFNDQSFQKGLIADSSSEVSIHVQPGGTVEEVGLTQPGFKLDDYVSWWGLGAVLG